MVIFDSLGALFYSYARTELYITEVLLCYSSKVWGHYENEFEKKYLC